MKRKYESYIQCPNDCHLIDDNHRRIIIIIIIISKNYLLFLSYNIKFVYNTIQQ
jgi:hypothetical protein